MRNLLDFCWIEVLGKVWGANAFFEVPVDGGIGVFDPGFVEDVDDGIGDEGLVYDLPDGGFDFDVAQATVAGFEFAEAGLDGLKERDFFSLGDRFGVMGGQRVDSAEGGDGIEEAVFDLWVGDIVSGGFEDVEFVASAIGEVGLVVESGHDAFDDFQFGQQ